VIRRVLFSAVLLASVVTHAEDIVAYEAEGEAPSAGADPRVAALDDAFARAVNTALGELVPADQRAQHKADLDREIVSHARLWVAKFTVTRDETNEDRRQLVVSVRIDRDKLRDQLAKLGVATQDTASKPANEPGARPAVILLRVATPKGIKADYGDGADKDVPGYGVLQAALRDAGMAVKRPATSGAAARATGDLPLDDAETDALADGAKADVVAIAGVTVGPTTLVRGQADPAALVTAHVRLIERRDHRVIGQGAAMAAARGDDAGAIAYGADHALAAALADVMPPQPKKLAQAAGYRGDDNPIGESGVVLVRLPTKTPWNLVLGEQKYLAGAKGVRSATLRRLSPGGWVIGVATGESLEKVAQIARKAPTSDSTAAVKIVGDIVEVNLAGGS
jgi:hypothetical protein